MLRDTAEPKYRRTIAKDSRIPSHRPSQKLLRLGSTVRKRCWSGGIVVAVRVRRRSGMGHGGVACQSPLAPGWWDGLWCRGDVGRGELEQGRWRYTGEGRVGRWREGLACRWPAAGRKAKQGKTRHEKTGQDKARQDKARRDKTRQATARQDKTIQCKTIQD